MKHLLLAILFLCFINTVVAQKASTNPPPPDTKFILNLLKSHPEKFRDVLKNINQREIQIIYTQINRDKDNKPTFKQFTYRLNPNAYFYPASTVKLPTIAVALEKINRLGIPGFTKYSRMEIDTGHICQYGDKYDSTSETKYPSIANYVRKMLLVSNNDAYNRMYEFCGQEYLNNRLWEMGYPMTRIVTRFFSNCDTSSNRYTNPMKFYDKEGNIIYDQPQAYNPTLYKNPLGTMKKGIGWVNGEGKLIKQPKNWTYGNYLNLKDLNDVLISLIFPQAVPANHRFLLTDDDYKFLHKYMSLYPSECEYPQYCPEDGWIDSWKKYLYYGANKQVIDDKNLRIFNIVGQAWGYLIDCAYFADFENKTEFFLSAEIYCNNKLIFDGKYATETVGFPFLYNLGHLIYSYEKDRKRTYPPNLDEFKVQNDPY
ncbi:MAG: serine hydrolase [Bacteroidota bacterium]